MKIAHSLTSNDTYLQLDDAYAEWYKNKTKETISKRMVLPVKHALQDHPESGKMWMKMIGNILINELGFITTTYNRCTHLQERDGKLQLLLRQVDDFMLGTTSEKAAKDLFNNIGIKIQFPSKKEAKIVPFKFLGVVKDYNGVNVKQTLDYIEMLCKSYLFWLLKSHGWDTMSSKPLPEENIAVPKNVIPDTPLVPDIATAASINKVQVNREDGLPV